jgi:hypothetical protein
MRFRPLVDSYKHYRHQIFADYLLRRPARGGDVADAIHRIRAGNALLAVAFNAPNKIAMQAGLVKKLVPNAVYVVLDNSSDDHLADEIESAAHASKAPYVRLPRAPWTGLEAGRAHALAMNWAWRHVILKGEPNAFGFIDHDIYPVVRTDPFAALRAYPVAGRIWHRPPRWHLWAGFCFFRFDAVRGRRLDFGRDWLAGVDTGGRNWWHLYRHLDPAKVADPGARSASILPGLSSDECGIEWLGDWLHEGHFRDQRRDLLREKELVVQERLQSLLTN